MFVVQPKGNPVQWTGLPFGSKRQNRRADRALPEIAGYQLPARLCQEWRERNRWFLSLFILALFFFVPLRVGHGHFGRLQDYRYAI
jgi:hypothetical protein